MKSLFSFKKVFQGVENVSLSLDDKSWELLRNDPHAGCSQDFTTFSSQQQSTYTGFWGGLCRTQSKIGSNSKSDEILSQRRDLISVNLESIRICSSPRNSLLIFLRRKNIAFTTELLLRIYVDWSNLFIYRVFICSWCIQKMHLIKCFIYLDFPEKCLLSLCCFNLTALILL